MRFLTLLLHFTTGQTAMHQEIIALRQIAFLGEPVFVVATAVPSRWLFMPGLCNLIFLIYVADATVRLWRMGGEENRGVLKLVVPHPAWEDFVILAFDEIRFCGATSIQVMRRMKAMVSDLILALPQERHKPLKHYQERLDRTIARSFADSEEKQEASVEDRQGLGLPRKRPEDRRN